MTLKLSEPAPEMEGEYRSFADDWARNGEEITPYSARLLDRGYAQWLDDTLRGETEARGDRVPAHTLFLTDETGRILGAVNIRHRLTPALLLRGGHIGYGVRPPERRRGYAERMLALALSFAGRLGIRRALVTCDRKNTASVRTILRCGGVLENEIPDGERVTRRYWIAL